MFKFFIKLRDMIKNIYAAVNNITSELNSINKNICANNENAILIAQNITESINSNIMLDKDKQQIISIIQQYIGKNVILSRNDKKIEGEVINAGFIDKLESDRVNNKIERNLEAFLTIDNGSGNREIVLVYPSPEYDNIAIL